MYRYGTALLLTSLTFSVAAPTISACPVFLGPVIIRTFREDAADSKLILYVEVKNARKRPDDGKTDDSQVLRATQWGSNDGTTDLAILKVLKNDPKLDNRTVIRVPSHIPIADPKNPPRFLLFGEVFQGKADFFQGIPGNQDLVNYVRGLLKIDAEDRLGLMRYCFDFLEHTDGWIAKDAFNQFVTSSDPEIREAVRKLPADNLRRWVRDEKTDESRLPLYCYLLGNCGNETDAPFLRTVLDRLTKKESRPPQIDRILIGYTLLDRKTGWQYTLGLLRDPANEYAVCDAALRSVRYFHQTPHPDVIGEQDILGALSVALCQSQIADIAIHSLREWKCWRLTDEILPLFDRKCPESRFLQRAIVAYALCCPDAKAARFMAEVRQTNPALVQDMEDLIAPGP